MRDKYQSIILSMHNIQRWGKPTLTRSGDMSVINSMMEAFSDLAPDAIYKKVVYEAIDEQNIKSLKELYPDLDFIKQSTFFKMNSVDFEKSLLFLPTIDIRHIQDVDKSSLYDYFDNLSKFKHILLFNISRSSDYYSEMIESEKETSKDFHNLELIHNIESIMSNAKVIYTHSIDMDDTQLLNSDIKVIFQYIQQLAFFDKQYQPNLSELNLENRPYDYIAFNRPSRFKGYSLWLKFMKKHPEYMKSSAYVSSIHNAKGQSMLSELPDIKKHHLDDEADYINNVAINKNNMTEVDKRICDAKSISVFDTAYNEDESFASLVQKFKSFLVTTNYNYVNAQDVIIEYAMFFALKNGCTLRWAPQSIDTMKSEEMKKTARKLNHMNLSSQIKFCKDNFSAQSFIKKAGTLV